MNILTSLRRLNIVQSGQCIIFTAKCSPPCSLTDDHLVAVCLYSGISLSFCLSLSLSCCMKGRLVCHNRGLTILHGFSSLHPSLPCPFSPPLSLSASLPSDWTPFTSEVTFGRSVYPSSSAPLFLPRIPQPQATRESNNLIPHCRHTLVHTQLPARSMFLIKSCACQFAFTFTQNFWHLGKFV